MPCTYTVKWHLIKNDRRKKKKIITTQSPTHYLSEIKKPSPSMKQRWKSIFNFFFIKTAIVPMWHNSQFLWQCPWLYFFFAFCFPSLSIRCQFNDEKTRHKDKPLVHLIIWVLTIGLQRATQKKDVGWVYWSITCTTKCFIEDFKRTQYQKAFNPCMYGIHFWILHTIPKGDK